MIPVTTTMHISFAVFAILIVGAFASADCSMDPLRPACMPSVYTCSIAGDADVDEGMRACFRDVKSDILLIRFAARQKKPDEHTTVLTFPCGGPRVVMIDGGSAKATLFNPQFRFSAWCAHNISLHVARMTFLGVEHSIVVPRHVVNFTMSDCVMSHTDDDSHDIYMRGGELRLNTIVSSGGGLVAATEMDAVSIKHIRYTVKSIIKDRSLVRVFMHENNGNIEICDVDITPVSDFLVEVANAVFVDTDCD